MADATPSEPLVLVEIDGPVGILRLNRPRVRNALNLALMGELTEALERLDADGTIRAVVLTGDERAFAAGADIGEMAEATAIEIHSRPNLGRWERIRRARTPVVAAVNGYALGGGCELAMACDMIVAGESALFGQPEINLGIMPGGGGTQRLVRSIGKAQAMELILTGRMMTAREAYAAGLITKVVADGVCLAEARRLAATIAAKPPLAVQLAKEAVLKAFDLPLEAGLAFERRSFELLFATEDRAEGMRAFLEKRPARFEGH